jgi:rhodanese-related sulfurtransferase
MIGRPPAPGSTVRSLLRGGGWILAGCVLLVVAWTVGEVRWDARLFALIPASTAENLGVAEARRLWSETAGLQVLDVRSAREAARGVIPGARCIPWGSDDFLQRLQGWDRSRPVLVYCEGGYRSRKAVQVLRNLGFRSVHHLHRGMMSWRWAGHPVADPAVMEGPSP